MPDPTDASAIASHYQTDFPAGEFRERRSRVYEAIGPDAIAVLRGMPASGAFDLFRQHNDFYYLSGLEVPHAYLLLDGRKRESTLYLPPRDPHHERSEGRTLAAEDAAELCLLSGVERVHALPALEHDLQAAATVFTPRSPAEGYLACRDTLEHARRMIEADPWDGSPSLETRFEKRLTDLLPSADFSDLSPILDSLRLVKSAAEVAVMRVAGRLTALAVTEAMRCTRAGLYEYQLAAVADYCFRINGARGGGYRPIVASGDNIWNPHYFRNDAEFDSSDWVLMDYAPDVRNYTSDIGRMWPVNGRYTAWQRELYGFIVDYHKVLLSLIQPGITAAKIYQDADDQLRPRVEKTAWSRPSFKKAAQDVLSYNRHLTHPVGMAVHDVGHYHEEPLRPGIVLALDPQLWIPDEQIYVRVEDTVVVTETGVENLTAAAPLELADVERVMQEPGLLAARPDLLQ
ncbi:MAG: aminopeptidase P N-terminal domain-containing protein [Planctomycetota bacterium]|nr:aminopeptidase P N-terminal domain-containing protein [Planctomycetota bacterium]